MKSWWLAACSGLTFEPTFPSFSCTVKVRSAFSFLSGDWGSHPGTAERCLSPETACGRAGARISLASPGVAGGEVRYGAALTVV
jgi:hypothetical protein